MKKYVAMLIGVAVIAGYAASNHAKSVAAQTPHSSAQFTADGKLILPKGFRKWAHQHNPDGIVTWKRTRKRKHYLHSPFRGRRSTKAQ
jgi:hypothetical protein